MRTLKMLQPIKKMINYLLLLSLYITATYADNSLDVKEVHGKVLVSYKNQSNELHKDTKVKDLSDIITTPHSQITLIDQSNHEFILAESSHISLLNKVIQLKEGHLWIKSTHHLPFTIHTANAISTYSKGEAITSFDDTTGRSQLLVISGNLQFSRQDNPDKTIQVYSGQFSFIDKNQHQEIPRIATSIGNQSFKKALKVFSHVAPSPVDDNTKIQEINNADIKIIQDQNKDVHQNQGKIFFIKANYKPRKHLNLAKLYAEDLKEINKHKKKKKKPKGLPKSTTYVHIFGQKQLHSLTTHTNTHDKFQAVKHPNTPLSSVHPQEASQLVDKIKGH